MKRLLLIALMLSLVTLCFATEKIETVTFGWDQNDLTNVTQWEMDWSVTAGGPYAQLTTIPYDGSSGTAFQSPIIATVTGEPGTTETRYFVLKACGDIPIEGGGTEYQCSSYSNEVSKGFWIPVGAYEVPINFRIIPE